MRIKEPSRIAEELRAWVRKKGLTEVELAQKLSKRANGLEISQSWLSRVMNGRFRRVTPRVRQIADYANIRIEDAAAIDRDGDQIIKEAVSEVWDGSASHAALIARLIRVARGLSH